MQDSAQRSGNEAGSEADAAAVEREFEAALARLIGEIGGLRRTFGAMIDQMGQVGEAGAAAARATAQAASIDGAATRARVTEELGGAVGGLKDDLARTAREHPWRTLALAAAAGIVLGLTVRR
jgi:ElaB/YqjD/DUF883 family membrane-anchored ribosome-binding protein